MAVTIPRGFSCWYCNYFEAKDASVDDQGECRKAIPQTDGAGVIIPRYITNGTEYWCTNYVVTPRDIPDPV